MAQYKKKPIVVEAYQITRELLENLLFKNFKYPKGLHLGRAAFNAFAGTIAKWEGYVTTIHGQKTKVVEGDWIIEESDGKHFYPCKPDEFNRIYELIEAVPDAGHCVGDNLQGNDYCGVPGFTQRVCQKTTKSCTFWRNK